MKKTTHKFSLSLFLGLSLGLHAQTIRTESLPGEVNSLIVNGHCTVELRRGGQLAIEYPIDAVVLQKDGSISSPIARRGKRLMINDTLGHSFVLYLPQDTIDEVVMGRGRGSQKVSVSLGGVVARNEYPDFAPTEEELALSIPSLVGDQPQPAHPQRKRRYSAADRIRLNYTIGGLSWLPTNRGIHPDDLLLRPQSDGPGSAMSLEAGYSLYMDARWKVSLGLNASISSITFRRQGLMYSSQTGLFPTYALNSGDFLLDYPEADTRADYLSWGPTLGVAYRTENQLEFGLSLIGALDIKGGSKGYFIPGFNHIATDPQGNRLQYTTPAGGAPFRLDARLCVCWGNLGLYLQPSLTPLYRRGDYLAHNLYTLQYGAIIAL